MRCRLCLHQKRLIEAHIIPKWVFKYLYPNPKNIDGALRMVSIKEPYSKRRPTGIYDDSILCQDCDNKIGRYDNYAKSIFLNKKIVPSPRFRGKAYLIQNIDVPKVKSFFISLLWKASVSNKEEFAKIKLGKYEPKFRKALANHKPNVNGIEVVLGKYTSKVFPTITAKSVLLPYKKQIKEIDTYIVRLPKGFKIWVKVDRRPFSYPFNRLVLRDSGNKAIIGDLGNYENTKEFEIMKSLAKKVPNPYIKTH